MPLPLLSFLVAPLVFLAAKRAAEKAQQEADAAAYEQPDEFVRLLEEAAKADPHDLEMQQAYGMALLALAGARAEKRPPTTRSLLLNTFLAAREHGNWAIAEESARRLIALNDSPMQLYRDWQHLAGILKQQGKDDEAYRAILTSTRAARKSKIDRLILMALRSEVDWAIRQRDRHRASASIKEGLKRAARMYPKFPWDEADFLVQRAQLYLDENHLKQAAQDLQAAKPSLFPTTLDRMLRPLRNWWFATARLCLLQGAPNEANAAAEEALLLARRIAEFPQLDEYDRREGLRRSLERYAELQEKLGNSEAATSARQEASALAP